MQRRGAAAGEGRRMLIGLFSELIENDLPRGGLEWLLEWLLRLPTTTMIRSTPQNRLHNKKPYHRVQLPQEIVERMERIGLLLCCVSDGLIVNFFRGPEVAEHTTPQVSESRNPGQGGAQVTPTVSPSLSELWRRYVEFHSELLPDNGPQAIPPVQTRVGWMRRS